MKILIAGSPKTGTTGLFYLLRNSMAGAPRLLFEETAPYTPEPSDDERGVLAKVVVNPDTEDLTSYDGFDKRIAIIRDPRDTLISKLLYGLGYHSTYDRDDAKVGMMYCYLKEFEESPGDMGLLDLIRCNQRLKGITRTDDEIRTAWAADWERMLRFYDRHPDYYRFRYEDFVTGRHDDLAAHLGFELDGIAEVDDEHHRVVRTKAADNWRHWMSPADVELFRPIYQDFLAEHGYDTSWNLNDDRVIPAAHASDYYYRLISEKRSIILRPISREKLLELGLTALEASI